MVTKTATDGPFNYLQQSKRRLQARLAHAADDYERAEVARAILEIDQRLYPAKADQQLGLS
jgi:hypothetical protein